MLLTSDQEQLERILAFLSNPLAAILMFLAPCLLVWLMILVVSAYGFPGMIIYLIVVLFGIDIIAKIKIP